LDSKLEGGQVTDTYLYEIDKRFVPVLALRDGVRVGDGDVISAPLGWLQSVRSPPLDPTLANQSWVRQRRGWKRTRGR
jgi:hypothetical protein